MTLDRENKLLIGLCAMAGILIFKLFSIQILDDSYKKKAEENTKEIPEEVVEEVAETIEPKIESEELEGEDLEAAIDALLTDTEQ